MMGKRGKLRVNKKWEKEESGVLPSEPSCYLTALRLLAVQCTQTHLGFTPSFNFNPVIPDGSVVTQTPAVTVPAQL